MKIYDDQGILITGGAGFIGSNLIEYLNEQGVTNIVIADELGVDEKWKNLVGKRFAEILEKDQLFDWLKGRASEMGAIIHLGACSSTTETDATYLLKNNYQYSQRLAEYAFDNEIRFIYASSAATYGDGSQGFSDDHYLLDQLRPLNMYGYSKHLFDLWLKNNGYLDSAVGLKYFNVFGPGESHKGRMASAIYHMAPQASREGAVRLFRSSEPEKYPDGGQMRDFIYVKDVARMTAAFLENEACGIYNIGRGTPITWNEVALALFEALGIQPRIDYIAMPEDLLGKYQNYTCADMAKTNAVLKNSACCISFNKSVIEYVQQYLAPQRSAHFACNTKQY